MKLVHFKELGINLPYMKKIMFGDALIKNSLILSPRSAQKARQAKRELTENTLEAFRRTPKPRFVDGIFFQ